jgi:gas vesicle protein
MSNIKQINGVFLSFLLGGAVGGAIALLYAPKSGRNLRNDIRYKANELYEDGKKISNDTWIDAKEKAEELIESANNVLAVNVDKIVRTTDNLKEALKSGIDAYNDERKYGNNHDGAPLKEDIGKTHRQTT